MPGAGLTRRGWTMLAAGVALCAGAGFLGQRDLWWPGLFLVALPLVSWLLLLPNLARLAVRREVEPDRVSVGGEARVRLSLTTRAPTFGGVNRIRDRRPAALGSAGWLALPVRMGQWQQQLHYSLQPQRRGRFRIGPLERSSEDGLGLARGTQTVSEFTELLVTPRVEPLTNLGAATGLGIAPDTSLLRTGLGSADDTLIREYQTGDDVRRIHWRSTARTGTLMVRREERARNPVVTIVVDNRSRSFGGHDGEHRLEWAIAAVASLAVHLLGDGFDTTIAFADGTVLSPPRSSSEREELVLEHLADLDTVGEKSLLPALAATATTEGQLLIALLGRIEDADLTALREAARHGRNCWALLVEPDLRDLPRLDALAASGWRCHHTVPGTPLGAAWTEFGRQEAR